MRRFQFSLRTFLIACVSVAILIAIPRYRSLSQQYAAKVLKSKGIQLIAANRQQQQATWAWLVYGDDQYNYVQEIVIEGTDILDSDVTKMREFPFVTRIEISRCPSSPMLLNRIAEFSELKFLKVSASPITNDHILEIAKVDLRALVVYHPPRSDLELSQFANGRACGLTFLSLGGQAINNATLQEVSKIKGIQVLSISNASVTDEGLRPLTNLSNLTDLSITGCPIKGSTLDRFTACAGLKELNLQGCRIDSAAIDRISRLHGLKWVDLQSTDVTKEDTLKLQRALPCLIWSDFGFM